MLTCALIILSGLLAQADAPLTTDLPSLQGQFVNIVYPPDTPLPLGWPESGRRSGRLDRVVERPRNPGEYTLTVTWDEPWAPSAPERLEDTVRDASGKLQKLVVSPESEVLRLERIKHGWEERGFKLISDDPLDPMSWMEAEEVALAERAQQMARENAPEASASEAAAATPETAPDVAPEQKPAGFLQMRLPQLVIALVALALAGLLVKTLVL